MKTIMGTRFSNLKNLVLRLMTVWIYVGSWMTPVHAMGLSKEVTGESVKAVAWRLSKGRNLAVRKRSGLMQIRTG